MWWEKPEHPYSPHPTFAKGSRYLLPGYSWEDKGWESTPIIKMFYFKKQQIIVYFCKWFWLRISFVSAAAT